MYVCINIYIYIFYHMYNGIILFISAAGHVHLRIFCSNIPKYISRESGVS